MKGKKTTRKKERKKYVNRHSQPTSLLFGNCLMLNKNKELDRIKGNKADLQTHSQHMCNARRV